MAVLNQTTINELKQAAREYKSEGEKAVKEAARIEAFLASVIPSVNGHLRARVLVTPAQKERVLKLSSRGLNGNQIAKKTGLPVGTAYSIVQRAQAKVEPEVIPAIRRKGRHAFTPTQVREIRVLLAGGMTQAAVAEKYGVHFTQISHLARRKSYAWVK